jgi:hypothetical protein
MYPSHGEKVAHAILPGTKIAIKIPGKVDIPQLQKFFAG